MVLDTTQHIHSKLPDVTDVAAKSSVLPRKVVEFLQSQSLDAYADNTVKGIVSEICVALENKEPIPYQYFGMNMLHWAVVAGVSNALKQMIGALSHEDFVNLVNQKNDAMSVTEALYERATGNLCPLINGDTPLGIALFVENKIAGHEGLAEELMKHLKPEDLAIKDPNVDAINNLDNSYLNLAAGGCDLQTVKQLAELLGDNVMSALINRQTTSGGSTPLHHAAVCGKFDVFQYLLEKGATESLSLKDVGGCTPDDHLAERVMKMQQEFGRMAARSHVTTEENSLKWVNLRKELRGWMEVSSTYESIFSDDVPENALNI